MTHRQLEVALAALMLVAAVAFGVVSQGKPSPAQPSPTPAPTSAAGRCHYRTAADGQTLPDPVCTPGAIDPRVTQANIQQTICTRGYTATVRPPLSFTEPLKRRQMVAYGQDVSKIAEYELDHFEALEIGGAPASEENLWVEPIESARVKDRVENAAREAVCNGRLSLADAQQATARDWTALGRQLGVVQP